MRPRPSAFLLRCVLGALSVASVLVIPGCGEVEERLQVPPSEWGVSGTSSFLPDGTLSPQLSTSGDGLVLSWWAEEGEETVLRFANVDGVQVGEAREVVRGRDFFVNWADLPSVTRLPSGRVVAHWLQRGGSGGTYDYGIRVSTSLDDGTTWDEPWTPHADGTPTEHGFVSVIPEGDDGFRLVWLDGRRFVDGPHGEATREMTLRARGHGPDGHGEERLLDERICDCCRTAAAWGSAGPVLAWRDRSVEEIRDIWYAVRDGSGEHGWTEARPIHDDGWQIDGCPVNGPSVAAAGDFVVITWFTGAQDRPRVLAKASTDAGRSFGPLLRLDHGNPIGRVAAVVTGPDRAAVVWIEGTGEEGAEIRLQEVGPDALVGDWVTVARTSRARAAGFPQIAASSPDRLTVVWTSAEGERRRIQLTTLDRSPT